MTDNNTQLDRDNYSVFTDNTLATQMHAAGVQRLWVGGLALDYCVRASVLDALRAGFEVHLIEDGTRAVNVYPEDGARTLAELRAAGAYIEET
jgi:nicotinamidase/pyrazinamidase